MTHANSNSNLNGGISVYGNLKNVEKPKQNNIGIFVKRVFVEEKDFDFKVEGWINCDYLEIKPCSCNGKIRKRKGRKSYCLGRKLNCLYLAPAMIIPIIATAGMIIATVPNSGTSLVPAISI